jgi:parvulin-like peptidyl-prolyl isomerase
MRRQAVGESLLGLAVWLACTAAAGAQALPGKSPPSGKSDTYVSAVSANIPPAIDKPAALVNAQIKALRQASVDMLVDDLLMRQFLGKHAPTVNPADVAKEMRIVDDDLKKTHKTIADFLKETGQTMDQLKKSVVARLQWQGYLHKRLSEEQARKYYDDNKPFFDKVLVRASHILVTVPANATAEQKQALLNKAQTIRQEIAGGKITFEAAVKQYSECPSKDKGGDIGDFQYRFTKIFPSIVQATFAVKINEVTGVVTTERGYHILKVTDRTQPKELSTYDSVRGFVREVWSQDVELYQQIIAHQRKNSKIEVLVQ